MQMCKDKGFDAVEPDNIDGYTNNTGFPLTAQNQITYNNWLADQAHALGLSIGLKNDVDQVAALQPKFNWALNKECNQYAECGVYSAFTLANKAIFNAEYKDTIANLCPKDAAKKINGVIYNLNLDGKKFLPCTNVW